MHETWLHMEADVITISYVFYSLSEIYQAGAFYSFLIKIEHLFGGKRGFSCIKEKRLKILYIKKRILALWKKSRQCVCLSW